MAGTPLFLALLTPQCSVGALHSQDPDKLVMVWKFRSDSGIWTTTPADYRDWRDQNKSFDQIGAYHYANFNLTGRGEPEKVLRLHR